jgi:hypothetical protein
MPEAKGMRNAYQCEKCGHETVTVNQDEGVTPFMIRCRRFGCEGLARSLCYNTPQQRVPTHAWYRPDEKRTKRLDEATREHVTQGGLLLRALDPLEMEQYGHRVRAG